jgi:hypothetical protein
MRTRHFPNNLSLTTTASDVRDSTGAGRDFTCFVDGLAGGPNTFNVETTTALCDNRLY